ncbi:MAG: pimeloyl-ACP methyl ester carboxylesterase [Myxococcota bacterium]|jgi:pimeloyl-ACP methyl ester carboxylesterase
MISLEVIHPCGLKVRYPPQMVTVLWMLVGCGTQLRPIPLTEGEGFFDRPWPDDRRTVDGRPDLSDFPERGEYDLLEAFIEVAEEIEGFATNGTAYVRFDGPLDTDKLPTPEQSLDTDASVILLNVDPSSPRRGEQVPLQWDYQEEDSLWQAAGTLAVQPIWGAPLEPGTMYAVVLSDKLVSPPDDFVGVWEADHPERDYYAPIQETLFQIRRSVNTVAHAFRFTTQDPTADFTRVVRAIDTWLPMPVWTERALTYQGRDGSYYYYTGELSVPLWQEGLKPYASEGGGFVFDEDGEPVLFGWDRCTFSLTVPVQTPPEEGWPVVIYSHGTGGSHTSFLGTSPRPAGLLADAGLAVIGIAQPLHGDRSGGGSFSAELYSFNFLNPTSGRTTFQQGGLDQVFLSRLLSESDLSFRTNQGGRLKLDGSRLGFLGHSQGGQVGALALPYFDGRVQAAVLSGTGGGLSITLMERDSGDFDIEGLISLSLDVDTSELDTFHPIIGLVQHDAEVTDPLNYAPFWYSRQPSWASTPLSVLQTEGLEDVYTPPWSTEALAGAAGTPILSPVSQRSPIQDVTGLFDEPSPTAGNRVAWDGSTVSAGLAQYADQGHFAIFYDRDAQHLYQTFLASALLDGEPEIAGTDD